MPRNFSYKKRLALFLVETTLTIIFFGASGQRTHKSGMMRPQDTSYSTRLRLARLGNNDDYASTLPYLWL